MTDKPTRSAKPQPSQASDNDKKDRRKKLILKHSLSPGDVMMLTAAVRDLHKSHPNKFLTDVRTPCPALWENNPYITKIDNKDPDAEIIKCEYPLINRSNRSPYHFIHGFRKFLEQKLDIKIDCSAFKGDIHISKEEKSWMSQVEEMGIKDDFWLIFSGGKYDFTAKWWDPSRYQEVVDHFKGRITFIQAGEKSHHHPELNNCVNLVGKTNLRQLIRLVYHSVGVVCPVTFAMHAAAAIPVKQGRPQNRAAVIVAGGREPTQWEAYPHHRFLSTNGSLDCCDDGGCWKSRCQKIGDGDDKDKNNLCIYPVEIKKDFRIPKCLDMIKAHDVIRAIEWYYEGGALKYGSDINKLQKLKEYKAS